MGPNTRANGRTTSNMAWVKNPGSTTHHSRAISTKPENMAKVSISGRTAPVTMVTGSTTVWKDQASTFGETVDLTEVNGNKM